MNDSQTIAEWAQVFASVFSGAAFLLAVYQLLLSRRSQQEADKKSLEAKQVEIYQRLEFESNVVFQFEAANRTIIPTFKTHRTPIDALTEGDAESREEARFIARKYYEVCCNLFEVAARLRRRGYVQEEVFGSWVAWYFDTLCEWGFRALWADLRDNYTKDLRDTFDRFVTELIEEWDIKLGAAPASDLCMPPEAIEALRTKFYEHVGQKFNCRKVTDWLSEARALKIPAHPSAFR